MRSSVRWPLASEDWAPSVRTVLADSDVLKERAPPGHLPSRVPFQTVHNIGTCTWSLCSHVLQAGYALDVAGSQRTTGPGDREAELERGRTN
jgi:hypothetical protein